MKNPSLKFLTPAIAALILGIAPSATKAGTLYFDANGTTAGYGTGGSWEGANWATASGGTSVTGNWTAGDFAEFKGSGTVTVTIGADESMAGLFQDGGGTLTINDDGSGNGLVDIASGVQGFITYGATIINETIGGTGGLDPEYGGSGAALSLFGNNTYSGGTALTSSSTLVYYNNNNSFGTGTISANYGVGAYAPLLSVGGSTITLANNIANVGTGGGINFANGANTPVVLNGTVNLGTTTFNIRNNGDSTAPLTQWCG